MDDYIKTYFQIGLSHKEILACLLEDGYILSLRHLRRHLRRLRLFRKKIYTDINILVEFLETQISTHGQLHGYRWMHLKCLQHGFVVTQNTVRELLRTLDPDGVTLRQRRRLRRRQYYNKGPNFLWHTDCYDKLKPFGICITGCIDGFSRYIIWLEVGPNTNDPSVIAYHFMQAVTTRSGCPQTLRADLGTENVIIERIQTNLKLDGPDALSHLPGFLYGTSHANQRIEAWWSTLRKHHSQFWMNVFHTLKDEGSFSGSLLDKSLIQFCFLDIIKEELDLVALEWNTLRITRSRNSIAPYGRPFMMYNRPQDFMSIDYLHPVSTEMRDLWLETIPKPRNTSDYDVYQLAAIIMEEEGWVKTNNVEAAIELYKNLRQKFFNVILV
ncbi:uncharacterized protein LOC116170868 [Photinus pyralis]|uniref:uncharacterized protein LOC116170868 n=1 Tax=Photinus pyralis TaxID=7054 RepID=UPI00126705F8|nr:uncharacterized protein LOC116170868 [Photinus pyralis]